MKSRVIKWFSYFSSWTGNCSVWNHTNCRWWFYGKEVVIYSRKPYITMLISICISWFTSMGIRIKIRQFYNHLIFIMAISCPVNIVFKLQEPPGQRSSIYNKTKIKPIILQWQEKVNILIFVEGFVVFLQFYWIFTTCNTGIQYISPSRHPFHARPIIIGNTIPVDILNAVEYCYNAVQYNKILHTSLQWRGQNINHKLNLQKTPHTSP